MSFVNLFSAILNFTEGITILVSYWFNFLSQAPNAERRLRGDLLLNFISNKPIYRGWPIRDDLNSSRKKVLLYNFNYYFTVFRCFDFTRTIHGIQNILIILYSIWVMIDTKTQFI